MKSLYTILITLLFCLPALGQYYLRGEVKNDKQQLLQFVKIQLASKGPYFYGTGAAGSFGIPVSKKTDTITLSLDGYETVTQVVETTKFQSLTLKPLSSAVNRYADGLMSLTKNVFTEDQMHSIINGAETYNSLVENDFIATKKAPETGIALNINCASYSNIRRFLNMGSTVPPDGVRIEEMLNYFNFGNDAKKQQQTFTSTTQVTTCPWNNTNQLLFINLQAPRLNLINVPPANLVFLIDISGSMDKDNRMPLVQAAFKMLVQNLRPQDTVGIVTYGGKVGIALKPTSGVEKLKITSVIDSLIADGDTPGSAAIQTAYTLAESIYKPGANNRVILATDGDFNVGQTSEKELEQIVTAHKQSGIYLTCLGVGMGNYKDSKLAALATSGNGNFAYIDNLEEAQKILLTEFTKNMYAVANDAYLTIEFNKENINAYRLIGFDNKKDALNDKGARIEGGELGSGHSLMAIFEIEPKPGIDTSKEIATISLSYKEVQNSTQKQQTFSVPQNLIPLANAPAPMRFATAVTMFGSLLKNSKYAVGYSWDDVQTLANSSITNNDILEREFITLVDKAKLIYTGVPDKKKKK